MQSRSCRRSPAGSQLPILRLLSSHPSSPPQKCVVSEHEVPWNTQPGGCHPTPVLSLHAGVHHPATAGPGLSASRYPAHSKIRVSPLEGKCMINFAVGSHPGWGSPILCSHVSIPQCKTNATHWSSSKHVPSVHGHALGLLPNSSLVTFLILPICKAPGMNPRVAGARSCSLPLQKAVHSLPCLIAFL